LLKSFITFTTLTTSTTYYNPYNSYNLYNLFQPNKKLIIPILTQISIFEDYIIPLKNLDE